MPRGPDTLSLQFVVPRFTTYVTLCERLETIERITDAVECFYDMTSELGGDVNP
ncbi:hypothetical protein L210DRAFT_949926 [Boletus edulis BED1]|uniref:Uncharacterized protein n=1 Tax=Boletus edulis BED1 TaxID=1328754 RepID=A0AAD4C7J0_BOLED|nr:hypothetical protein L210DRAFT_949926 [Boletus edulis BED1]